MDCDRFEATLLDELYEELDELTSAAAKRHVAGCARCAALLGGLRATRRVAVLPRLEPSADLEDRILAAAHRAHRAAPAGRRLSRAVSWAGSWAMRPQTAMAAVFLLMVGSSLLFVRRSKVGAMDSNVTVTAEGTPAPAQAPAAAAEDRTAAVDSKLAAAAHGAGPTWATGATGSVPAAPGSLASASAYAAPTTAPAFANGPAPAASAGDLDNALAQKDLSREERRPSLPKSPYGGYGGDYARNAEAPAGAPQAAARAVAHAPARSGGADDESGGAVAELDKKVQTAAPPAQAPADGRAASSTEWASALQSARSQRDTNGCGAATPTLDRIGNDAWGTSAGYQATFDAAQCYKALGQTDQAVARYRRLLTVQQFSQQASQGIASVQQVGGGQAAGKIATRKAAPVKSDSSQANQSQAPAAPAAPPPQATPAQQQGAK